MSKKDRSLVVFSNSIFLKTIPHTKKNTFFNLHEVVLHEEPLPSWIIPTNSDIMIWMR